MKNLLKLLNNRTGVSIPEMVGVVTLFGLLALGSIKFLDIRYSKKSAEPSDGVLKLSKKIQDMIVDNNSCVNTFGKKNIVRQSQTFSSIRDSKGTEVFKLNDIYHDNTQITRIEVKNIDLNYKSRGIFLLSVTYLVTGKFANASITRRSIIKAKLDSKGQVMACNTDGDQIVTKAFQTACREFGIP